MERQRLNSNERKSQTQTQTQRNLQISQMNNIQVEKAQLITQDIYDSGVKKFIIKIFLKILKIIF
jgi:hypothetical protein